MFNKYPCILQHDTTDCAAAAVATILKYYKVDMSIMKVREVLGTNTYGTTVKGVIDGLADLKFDTKAMRTDIDQLMPNITLPAIAQIVSNSGFLHFVVIHKITKKDTIIIADPEQGIRKIKRKQFANDFTGVLILALPKSDFEILQYKNKGMFELFSSLILPQKKMIATILLTSIILSLIGIGISTSSKILMDQIIPNRLKNTLFVFMISFALIMIIQSLLASFRQHIIIYFSRKIDIPVLMGYYNHIMHLPYEFFVSRKIGDIITRFQDAMTIKSIFTNASISLVLDLGLSIISALVLFNMNATLFLILFIMVLINILLVYFFKKSYKKINYQTMDSSSKLNSHIIESIKNIETIKSQNDEKQQIEKLESKFVNLLKVEYKEGVLQNIQSFVSSTISAIGNLFFMCVGASFIIDGKMSIGDLLVFQSISQYFTNPIQSIVSLQLTFQEAQIAMKRLSELMDVKREDECVKKIENIDLNGDIEFVDVMFAYGSRSAIIENLNLKIKKGQKIAIIGESGAGKSTIAKLLLKFITSKEGRITLSGYDIKDIDSSYLRKKIAYIPQDIELFTGTILDNLLVGNENATFEEVILACKKVGADQFIRKLPKSYESYVEEGGANLSGGEKQRIAIARALISKPDLYIFDEATSNLDSFSEKQIHQLIFNHIQDKTVIIIAHRLSTVVHCDYIYLLDSGKIQEEGTHEHLLKLNKKYAKMINTQSLVCNHKIFNDKVNKIEECILYE